MLTYVTFIVLVALPSPNRACSSSEAGSDSRPSPAARVHSELICATTRSPPSLERMILMASGTTVNVCVCVPLLRSMPSCTVCATEAMVWRSESSANWSANSLFAPFCSTSAYRSTASCGVATRPVSFGRPIWVPISGTVNRGSWAPANRRATPHSL